MGSLIQVKCFIINFTQTNDIIIVLINRSESPSQVFLLLIQWLISLVSSGCGTEEMFLAYDNMCHLNWLR